MLVALLLTGGLYYRSHRQGRLTEKDTIVLADFANHTGDAVFDDALKTALSVALRQSPFLNLLSDDRVGATLKLMTRPTNTPLTPEVTREVCQRSHGKAYIAGSIATLGTKYVLKEAKRGLALFVKHSSPTRCMYPSSADFSVPLRSSLHLDFHRSLQLNRMTQMFRWALRLFVLVQPRSKNYPRWPYANRSPTKAASRFITRSRNSCF